MAEPPKIHTLMIEVMRRVRAVGKDQRNREQAFNFRGVDDVVNALGPALRDVGVLCMPQVESVERQATKTTRGKDTRETVARVRYRFIGPAGDFLDAVTEGESLDTGDKGTAKAFSVAWRIALIQTFSLPTDEPDPDHDVYERGGDYRDDGRYDDRDERDRGNGRGRREPSRGRDDRRRTSPDRVNAEDSGDERDDLIDTDDPDEARDVALLSLKDKLRYYKIKKDAAADVFAAIFGEELPTADATLIDRFMGLIVQLGQLPDIDADPSEQHPAVARLMAVPERSEADIEQDRQQEQADGGT